jgi:hypothetical protein
VIRALASIISARVDKPNSFHPILHFDGEGVEDKDNSIDRESVRDVE